MALETLKGVKEIGGFEVTHVERSLIPPEEIDLPYILIREGNEHSIAFTLQKGPIKEVGVNGCQIDTIIETAKLIIEGLNAKFPCEENEKAIFHLTETIGWLAHRTANRTERGVEGTNQA